VIVPLPDLVSDAFSDSSSIWFPEAAPRFVQFLWDNAPRQDFSHENYGTHRWRQDDPTLERTHLGRFDLSTTFHFSIEVLPDHTRRHYEKTGLIFSDEHPGNAILTALGLIRCVPSLYDTISLYLRSIHLLAAPSDDHDVSHSDPAVPFSIFVSVPPSDARSRLRLAESIVHECMHLQLSAIEKIVPLVADTGVRHFSPWQQTMRPVSGLLHGLYVFVVIQSFLSLAARSNSLTSEERQFAISRCRRIANEVDQACSRGWTKDLSGIGRRLARRLCRCLPSDT